MTQDLFGNQTVQASEGVHMNVVKTEIGQLEKALNVLIWRPRLIRRDYWTMQIERLLARTPLTVQDRQRLLALLDLLGRSGESGD
ncbi:MULTISPECIES: hypothetical protein [unclassified Paraburkholderia]|uniref:hypothetical protein n=1 Tax=unclassified Paraburkholderia TaxID=2615204 RepID=UPI0016211358|nr:MULTISPECIES: hypothetical protein [unclassified Paraburkholderia]MBB5446478.1 hypothetical protein [Paraburkholderia sp. WSM4177]MBB5486940.1 hypothetical protein [Paraburkholderia sp. WSM4180]